MLVKFIISQNEAERHGYEKGTCMENRFIDKGGQEFEKCWGIGE